jgi:hypothetical protein
VLLQEETTLCEGNILLLELKRVSNLAIATGHAMPINAHLDSANKL